MSHKPLFLEIIKTWPSYYDHFDEGLGTTYERFILHCYFDYLYNTYKVDSVIEVPSFGMTGVSGINSLWWSAKGITPVVVDNNAERLKLTKKVWNEIPLSVELHEVNDFNQLPFESASFDLSWNFANLWFVNNLDLFLNELARVTKKVIFLCIPNYYGIGYQIRDKLFDKNQNEFYPDHIKHKKFIPILEAQKWKVVKSGYFDIPPWPDIAMKKEELLKKLGLGFILKKKAGEADNTTRLCITDYFNGTKPHMEKEILKYAFLEKAPFPVKQLWGHHRFFIFEKRI
jgi:hypothetical protein